MALHEILLYILHYILALKRALFVWLNRLKPVNLSFKKQTVSRFLHDSKNLKKLPIHMGVVIVEDEISYADIANIIIWSMAVGIHYISLYDRAGSLKRHSDRISHEFQQQQQALHGAGSSQFDIEIHKSRTAKSRQINGCNKNHADVILLSLEDGRKSIVDTAKELSKAVSAQQCKLADISTSKIEEVLLEKQGYPDPDLVLRFGRVDSLLGYLPWQTRLTEILFIPSLYNFNYHSFIMALRSYGDTNQRFGK